MIKARLGADVDQAIQRIFPFLTRVRLDPNALTMAGVGAAGASGIAFAVHAPRVAGLLLILAGIFDLIDGIVARNQGRSSAFGAFFDSTMDRVSELLVFAGIGFAMASRADSSGILLLFWALLGSFMTSYTRARAEKDLASLSAGLMERAERCVVLIVGALSGFLQVALLIIALGSTLTAIQRIRAARGLLRVLEETGRDPTLEEVPAEDEGTDEEVSHD